MGSKIAVIGAKGMLGTDLCAKLKKCGIAFIPLDIADLDITSLEACRRVLGKIRPDIIINVAAYTQVDLAEDEREKAFLVNAGGPKNLAISASEIGASLCHISTDYVFDGEKDTPYVESDKPNPLSVYGKSKLKGEDEVLCYCQRSWIIRTAWLYGLNGKNFVKTIVAKAKEGADLKVVVDQFGSPTFTVDLAHRIIETAQNAPFGIYHATNSGSCSWHEFAVKILHEFDLKCKITPIKSEEWKIKTARPKNSVLDNRAAMMAGLSPMPSWEDALKRYARLQSKGN